MARLFLTVKGQLGAISLGSFLTVIDSTFGILKDLDSAISKQPKGSMDWVIESVDTEHSIGMGLLSKARVRDADYGDKVSEVYTDGIDIIRKEGKTPPYFSDNCLRLVNRQAKVLGHNGAKAFEILDVTRHKTTEIQPQFTDTTKQLVGYKYKSFGSIEGTLEMISIHKPARFNIYHHISMHAVKCNLRDEDIDRVRDSLGRRVIVSGLVSYNAKDEPKSVMVEELEVMPLEKELPTIEDFIGSDPDFTGSMSTKDFIRSIRSA